MDARMMAQRTAHRAPLQARLAATKARLAMVRRSKQRPEDGGIKRLAAVAGLAGAAGAVGAFFVRLRGDKEEERAPRTAGENGSIEEAAARGSGVADAISREVQMSQPSGNLGN